MQVKPDRTPPNASTEPTNILNGNRHRICFRCENRMELRTYEGWNSENLNCLNVEHINPKSAGGTSESYNLKAIHKHCNK